jgi:hypothetical protein
MEDIMSAAEETEASTPTRGATDEQSASDPKTFDLAAWVEGITPVRHATRIYARGDLVAELDLVKDQIIAAKTGRDYETVKALRDQGGVILDALEKSALDVVVEGWSPSRVEAFQKPLKEQGLSDEDILVRQTVAQVVEPEGFTSELFQSMRDALYPQAMQVVASVVAANNRAPVVSIPS